MAFKMKQGSSPNFKDLGSALPKKTKTLGKVDDYEVQQVRNPRTGKLENAQKNTLTKTNERTGKSKTKDISQRRADRITKRQARKKMAPQAREDKRNSGKNETDQQQQDRISRDFPADYGTDGYEGPNAAELAARHKITDKAAPGKGKNTPTAEEVAKYKKDNNLPTY